MYIISAFQKHRSKVMPNTTNNKYSNFLEYFLISTNDFFIHYLYKNAGSGGDGAALHF